MTIFISRLLKLALRASYVLFITNVYASNSTQAKCEISSLSELKFLDNTQQITYLPNYGCLPITEFAGYLDISNSNLPSKKTFYWLVPATSNAQTAPLILWINGGPGSSSMYGFFGGIGAYSINQKLQLTNNPYGFNTKYNLVIMDQPLGVGFSTVSQINYIKNEQQTTYDFYNSVQALYKKYPELRKLPLFIAGESYAGHYITKLAAYIIQNNHETQNNSKIHLQGVLIGDGWVNPLVQQAADGDYAYSHGLIDKDQQQIVDKLIKSCRLAISETSPASKKSNDICNKISDFIRQKSHLDLHNIYKQDNSNMYLHIESYLNLPAVKASLHVDPKYKFKLFNQDVANNLEVGEQDSVVPIISYLLEHNLKVLIYNGLNDATDCNFIGTDHWLAQLNWQQFNDVQQQTLYGKHQQVIGYIKSNHNLTQVKFLNAGHMVGEDQPENLLAVLMFWLAR